MSDLVGEIEKGILKRSLFSQGQSILVAVSGGLDSMVLLSVLHRLAGRHDWKLLVAHLNHQLRGRSSDADERLVCRTAKGLGLSVVSGRANVRALAKAEKLSLEMAARKARHDFLAKAAVQARASAIALAHHADDQLELFFLRLLRGSGSDGLTGMKWSNPSPVIPKIQLVRPLLDHTKAALRGFAQEQKLAFQEDVTNASLDIPRNRIRHELLPLLRKGYQPALASVIARVLDITSAEAELASGIAHRWLQAGAAPATSENSTGAGRRGSRTSGPPKLAHQFVEIAPGTPFDRLPVAVQRRCLQIQLINLSIQPDYGLIESLRLAPCTPVSISPDPATSSVSAPRGIFRDPQGVVYFQDIQGIAFGSNSLEITLDEPAGEVVFGGIRVHWRIQAAVVEKSIERRPGLEIFDADRVGSSVLLRNWLPGDRFQPIGMSGSVKLQDFLVNQKVPRKQRHQLVLALTAGGEVFWVEGLRISERFKLTPKTIRSLHWAWQKL